jgi:hypothetical protein
MINRRFHKANISLITVIVIGAVLILISTALITSSLDNIMISTSYNNTSIAEINGRTCLEEAMGVLKVNPNYTGTTSTSIKTISCTYTVINDAVNPAIKMVSVESIYGDTRFKIVKRADTSKNPYELTNY